MTERLKNESGYTLIEILVAILLLSIAIIPMVGMFDAGLRAAVLGSNYDKARALANGTLEEVKSLPFADDGDANNLLERYTPVNEPGPPVGLGAGTPVSCDEDIFDCEVTTTYMNEDYATEASTRTLWIKIDVVVRWDGSKSFRTSGLVAREI